MLELATPRIGYLPDAGFYLLQYVLGFATLALVLHCLSRRRLPERAKTVHGEALLSLWIAAVPASVLGELTSSSWDRVLELRKTLGLSGVHSDASVLVSVYGVCFLAVLAARLRLAVRGVGDEPPPAPEARSSWFGWTAVATVAALYLAALVVPAAWRALDPAMVAAEAYHAGAPLDPWDRPWLHVGGHVFSQGPDGASAEVWVGTNGLSWSEQAVYLGWHDETSGLFPPVEQWIYLWSGWALSGAATLLALVSALARWSSPAPSRAREWARIACLGLPLLAASCGAAYFLRLPLLDMRLPSGWSSALVLGTALALPALWALARYRLERCDRALAHASGEARDPQLQLEDALE